MTESNMPTTRAVILCAGRGSRLGAASLDKPKVLTELVGLSLLEWKLRALHTVGIDDIHLLTGYQAEKVAALGLPCIHNDRWATTNMVATLLCADPVLRRPGRTVVCYGDVVFHPDILRAALASAADIVLPYDVAWRALWEERFSEPLADAESFAQRDGRLLDIGQRVASVDAIEGQFMGIVSLTAAGWLSLRSVVETLPDTEVDRLDTTGLLSKMLARGAIVHTVPCSGRWCEVDSQDDLRRYVHRLSSPDWHHDWRWESQP